MKTYREDQKQLIMNHMETQLKKHQEKIAEAKKTIEEYQSSIDFIIRMRNGQEPETFEECLDWLIKHPVKE